MLAILFAFVANAATPSYYLESIPSASRDAATLAVDVARDLGWKGRVVRRYAHGEGWEYLARVESWQGEEQARLAAARMAERLHQPVALFRLEGDSAWPVDVGGGAQPQLASGAQTVKQAAATYGSGWSNWGGRESVEIAYSRRVGSTLSVEHRWRREAAEEWGLSQPSQGTASLVYRGASDAWLKVSGKTSPLAAEKAQSILDGIGPRGFFAACWMAARAGGEGWTQTERGLRGPGEMWVRLPEQPDGAVEVEGPGGEHWSCRDWRWVDEALRVPWEITHQRAGGDDEIITIKALQFEGLGDVPDLPRP